VIQNFYELFKFMLIVSFILCHSITMRAIDTWICENRFQYDYNNSLRNCWYYLLSIKVYVIKHIPMTDATYDLLVTFEFIDVPSVYRPLNREISCYSIMLFVYEYSTFLSLPKFS